MTRHERLERHCGKLSWIFEKLSGLVYDYDVHDKYDMDNYADIMRDIVESLNRKEVEDISALFKFMSNSISDHGEVNWDM